MIQRVLMTAIIAGFVAGVFASVAQTAKVVPLVLEAETYETAGGEDGHNHSHGEAAAAAAGAEEVAAHSHGDGDEWAPEDGLERTVYTVLSNVVTGVGFGLLLCAGIVLRGKEVDARAGSLWGIAGFVVFSLMPAVGLPPELPGTGAAALETRQLWWFLTIGCSAAGLSLILFMEGWIWRIAGIALIAVPHVIGAPHPEIASGTVPPSLAAEFAVASLATSALFWVVLGAASGWLFQRFSK